MTDETLPEPITVHVFNRDTAEYEEHQVYTAATLRQAVKRANYELLMRLHEENKHKHNFFHCAAVKLMEDSK